MKKIIYISIVCFFAVNLAWANQTRMGIFMAGDYIDDLVNIDIYPHQIAAYENNLYGDITAESGNYGIILTPDIKYGALACWQNAVPDNGFNIGYGINLRKFNIGISGSPIKDHIRFGISIGRTYFSKRFDISFLVSDAINGEWYKFNLRLSKRKGDFMIVPKYTFDHVQEPYEYNRHRIGLMLQRLILNEGFVYFIAEYDFSRGDIENDYTHIYAGLELPMTKKIALLFGIKENFINGFESPEWQIEPGISIRIREFSLDFHLNGEGLFDEEVTLFESFGLDLNFGRF